MKTKILLVVALLTFPFSFLVAQDSNYVVPKTEWDHPDLQGVWNFNSETPLQRPEEFGDREYLTPEDCLLYTSPSPRDYAASRMPSSA